MSMGNSQKCRFFFNQPAIVFAIAFCLINVTENANAQVTLADTVEKIKPSVVGIGTFMPKRSPRALFLGTGFVVGNGEVVVTNAHVIPEALDKDHLEELAVFYRNGTDEKIVTATEIAVDKDHDLAVLKLSEGRLPPLKLGNVSSVREGQLYAFTGYPIGMVLGLHPVTHRGIISAISPVAIPLIRTNKLNEKLLKRLQDPYPVFQLDATAYPGNSGSPLYDTESGEVIGVINKVFIQESKETAITKPSGITYAIPVNHVEKLLRDKKLY